MMRAVGAAETSPALHAWQVHAQGLRVRAGRRMAVDGLDPDQRRRFRALLRELSADTCVLVATHLVEDVAAACTDVLLIDEGRLVFRGVPADLAAAGGGDGSGDSPTERGYAEIMRRHREGTR